MLLSELPKFLWILDVAFDDQVVRRSSSVAHLLCVRPEGPAGLCPKLTLFRVLPGRGRSEARPPARFRRRNVLVRACVLLRIGVVPRHPRSIRQADPLLE